MDEDRMLKVHECHCGDKENCADTCSTVDDLVTENDALEDRIEDLEKETHRLKSLISNMVERALTADEINELESYSDR